MRVIGIIACDLNGGIGINNKIPWNIPSDLQKFKHITMDQTVVMGRNTFESLPSHVKPLPGRVNIVVTHVPDISHPSVYCTDVKRLRQFIRDGGTDDQDMYIIGGSSIIRELFDTIDVFYLTHVMASFQCDTFVNLRRIKRTFSIVVQESELKTENGVSYFFEKRMRRYRT